mmetsp:Transcript_718/g.952  ORF Transcript_718/g.952 Transcript_718/m.952 type:complete len:222 (-) Transcript_718:69-734(-)
MRSFIVLAIIALISVSVFAFTNVQTVRSISLIKNCNSVLNAKFTEDDFIPSERWYQEYLGQEGIRYSMGKTPQEIEKEGDYNIFQAMFGQTSNNEKKKELKQEARIAAYKNKDKERSDFWLQRYGYPRFFPAYIDRSGEDETDNVTTPPTPVAAPSPVAVKPQPKKTTSANPQVQKPTSTRIKVVERPKAPVAAPVKASVRTNTPKKTLGNLLNLPKKSTK